MRNIIKKDAEVKDIITANEDYIGFSDFALRGIKQAEFKITAIDIDAVPIPMSSKVQECVVATLEGQKKALIISKGKRKELIGLFGEFKNWIGKSIIVEADPTKKFKGKVTGGLNIIGEGKKTLVEGMKK